MSCRVLLFVHCILHTYRHPPSKDRTSNLLPPFSIIINTKINSAHQNYHILDTNPIKPIPLRIWPDQPSRINLRDQALYFQPSGISHQRTSEPVNETLVVPYCSGFFVSCSTTWLFEISHSHNCRPVGGSLVEA